MSGSKPKKPSVRVRALAFICQKVAHDGRVSAVTVGKQIDAKASDVSWALKQLADAGKIKRYQHPTHKRQYLYGPALDPVEAVHPKTTLPVDKVARENELARKFMGNNVTDDVFVNEMAIPILEYMSNLQFSELIRLGMTMEEIEVLAIHEGG